MIKPEQIPDEVYKAWHDAFFADKGGREAIAAALSVWPGMHEWSFSDNRGTFPALILPLMENPDDKA